MGRKYLTILVLLTIIFLLVFTGHRPGLPWYPSPLNEANDHINERSTANSWSVESRRRLAATVAEVQREILRVAGKNAVVDAKWSIKLAAVAEELDPRIILSVKNSWDFSARLPNMNSSQLLSSGGTRHVCPEVYYVSKRSSYSQEGMEAENCTYVPQFSSVLTTVLPATSWEPETVNFVIKQIRKFYDIPIVAIVSSTNGIDETVSALTIEKVGNNYDEGSFMNELSGRIKTPYVLIATSLAHFNNQSSLERLVRVLDELEHVKVAAGAARDLEGHWIHGCLQQRMVNFEARYSMGYQYSKYECMYCDDLLTPFVTTTAFIRQITFTKGLGGSALYRDWFAKIQVNGQLTMACPDVMFYVRNHSAMNEKQWLMFAKRWSLEKIISYDGKQYSFDCSSVGINCYNALGVIHSYTLAPCCRARMDKLMSYITNYAKEHNLAYELYGGSALGAMKVNGFLPWDFDHDVNFKCKDFGVWHKAGSALRSKGLSITVNRRNEWMAFSFPYFFMDIHCNQYNAMSTQFLPREYQNIPTKIKYSGGKDIVVCANPGLYSRNFYGIDVLKHSGHARTQKATDLGRAKGGYNNPGFWNPCKNPNHHACLDRYPGDGNLPFLEPFLHI